MIKKEIEQLEDLLKQLACELKAVELWQALPPSDAALSSSAPFCYDTLSFQQWLQFIFIPKMIQLITSAQPLPRKIALTPMAEESFKHLVGQGQQLIDIIQRIDLALSEQ